jgi:hypothetical protein
MFKLDLIILKVEKLATVATELVIELVIGVYLILAIIFPLYPLSIIPVLLAKYKPVDEILDLGNKK